VGTIQLLRRAYFAYNPDVEKDPELRRVQQERDLYRKLLELGTTNEIEPFLEEALAVVATLTGARRGYLELRSKGSSGDRVSWMARGCSDEDIAALRAQLSTGVIAQALATGQTISTVSALNDPRFRDLGSVRKNQIEAVLCTPIGADPPFGLLYLQDREVPGPFSEEDRLRAETFGRYIAAFADRLLLLRRRREESDATRPYRRLVGADRLVGHSVALAKVLHQVSLVAPVNVSVLLSGPTGSGKTLIARLIHDNSARAAKPFVELNCATLPEPLIESELFGAHAGAHSTAPRRLPGKVEAAEGGTLFLDEVSELALNAQAKLLQLLQSKEYYPLGSPRPMLADVRIVAATNSDLKAAVARKTFREDLFYRLQVLPLRVPSLAERRDDLAALAGFFCDQACDMHHLSRLQLSSAAVRAVENAEWAGNVRELANGIQAAAIRAAAENALFIEPQHLFPDAKDGERVGERVTFQGATRHFQSQLLEQTLEAKGWNITETAAALDLTRSHVYNLIHAFGLEKKRP